MLRRTEPILWRNSIGRVSLGCKCRLARLGLIGRKCRSVRLGLIGRKRKCRLARLGLIGRKCRSARLGLIGRKCRLARLGLIGHVILAEACEVRPTLRFRLEFLFQHTERPLSSETYADLICERYERFYVEVSISWRCYIELHVWHVGLHATNFNGPFADMIR